MTRSRIAVAISLCAVSPASADILIADRAAFISGGGSVAAVYPDGVTVGSALGLELSAGVIEFGKPVWGIEVLGLKWAGGYLDVQRDAALDQVRASIGPELGIAFVGIDAGRVFGDADGWTARVALTAGVAALYLRRTWLDDPSEGSQHLYEVGLLLKFPLLPR